MKRLLLQKGFTIIEIIAVIVVLGIVSVGISNFLGLGANVYVDAVGRERVVNQTRFMMERLTRELREALPNSVRVNTTGTINCLEFVPIQASSTYMNIPVAPEAATNSIAVVQHAVSSISANKIAVYPLTSSDVYGTTPTSATTGNVFSLNTVPSTGTTTQTITLTNSVRFDADSPTGRYYLVNNAIAYCVDTSNGEVKRYAGYWPASSQTSPPSGVTGVLMAEGVNAGTTPFNYSSATLVTNAVVKMTFEMVRDDEQIDFHHEVHLINVP